MAETKTILEAAEEARRLVIEMIAARERAIKTLREFASHGADHGHAAIVPLHVVEREAEMLAEYLEKDDGNGFHFAEAMGHALELAGLAKLAMEPRQSQTDPARTTLRPNPQASQSGRSPGS